MLAQRDGHGGKRFQHLTLDERQSLFRMREARLGVTEMASRLGWHRSTIYGQPLLHMLQVST